MPTRQPIATRNDVSTLTNPSHAYPTEWVDLATLTPHPRNYRAHPADQLAHIQASLQAHGFYRNIVLEQDVRRCLCHRNLYVGCSPCRFFRYPRAAY